MAKRYRLMLIILLVFGYCWFVYLVAYKWTYNDLQENKLYDENALTGTGVAAPEADEAMQNYSGNVVTAETVYILEKYDIVSGNYENDIMPVPIEVLGFDKEELFNYYVNYSHKLKNAEAGDNTVLMGLSEQEVITSVKSMELVSFENNVLVVRMSYEYSEPEYRFKLEVDDERIVVYELTTNEIFANTDIKLQDLPYALRLEIEKGKYFINEVQLFYFLESYSS